MSVPFTQYPGGLGTPSLGPSSIFSAGVLDFPSAPVPVTAPTVVMRETGKPLALWPTITKLYRFSMTWSYTSRELAENVLNEFDTVGTDPFEYTYPGDGYTYRCYWENAPTAHPVTHTAIWTVTGSLLAVRV